MTDETPDTKPDDKPAATRKPRRTTRAQAARAEAAKAQIDVEKVALDAAESFQVVYPTGYSWHVGPDEDEISYEMGPDTVWVDVVDEHVTVPKHGLFRATSLKQLEELRVLAGQGMLARTFVPQKAAE
ncbi:hypothetical protein [Kineosporia babensis]|uniref:Uncharacterized protein n=1 Tax=Kineosporia babensis TaxID=499548 RepID=A0A9X1ND29_9ACTN|nr:hypothetical protein [Kineosporia babensis]MCD5310803.1 hypothetical protein [Kineosporia babensis]